MTSEGLLMTIKDILLKEGPHGFYKGVGAPLVSIPVINSIIFSTYELSKKFVKVVFKKEELSILDSRALVTSSVLVRRICRLRQLLCALSRGTGEDQTADAEAKAKVQEQFGLHHEVDLQGRTPW